MSERKATWETVFEFDGGSTHVYGGSRKVTEDGIDVCYEHRFKGKVIHSVLATMPDEIAAQLFFFDKINLNGSWLIMRTLKEKECKEFHDEMQKIESRVPPALLALYEGIMGPLADITQDKIDSAVIELKNICESWYK